MSFIWFDDNKKIYAVTEEKVHNNPNYISSPSPINAKINKTVSISCPKLSPSGKYIYLDSKNKETEDRFVLGKPTTPVFNKVSFTRQVSIHEAPSEWSINDVMEAKYSIVSNIFGYSKFWFDELLTLDIVDLSNSQISTSTKGVSIAPKGSLNTKVLSLPQGISSLYIYVESASKQNIDIFYKFNEEDEFIEGNEYIKFNGTNIWLSLRNKAEDYDLPIYAFGLFY